MAWEEAEKVLIEEIRDDVKEMQRTLNSNGNGTVGLCERVRRLSFWISVVLVIEVGIGAAMAWHVSGVEATIICAMIGLLFTAARLVVNG